jgi:hypothetical protein
VQAVEAPLAQEIAGATRWVAVGDPVGRYDCIGEAGIEVDASRIGRCVQLGDDECASGDPDAAAEEAVVTPGTYDIREVRRPAGGSLPKN